MRRLFLIILGLYFFPGTTSMLAQGIQDPQAVATLNSFIAASGNAAVLAAVQDFVATGSITYNWANQNVQGSVILKALGTSNFRVDATLPTGIRSWAVTGLNGTLVDTDGSRSSIPSYNAMNTGILAWPIPNIIAALSNSGATISYLGLVQSDAGSAIQVHFQVTDASNPDPATASLNAIDYFFDPNTHLLIEMSSLVYPVTGPTQGLPHEILFASYQDINGILVPFALSEAISGQTTWSAQLTGISFNVGLTLADFQL